MVASDTCEDRENGTAMLPEPSLKRWHSYYFECVQSRINHEIICHIRSSRHFLIVIRTVVISSFSMAPIGEQ